MIKNQYGSYGSPFDLPPKCCDDYSSRTTTGREKAFSSFIKIMFSYKNAQLFQEALK